MPEDTLRSVWDMLRIFLDIIFWNETQLFWGFYGKGNRELEMTEVLLPTQMFIGIQWPHWLMILLTPAQVMRMPWLPLCWGQVCLLFRQNTKSLPKLTKGFQGFQFGDSLIFAATKTHFAGRMPSRNSPSVIILKHFLLLKWEDTRLQMKTEQ